MKIFAGQLSMEYEQGFLRYIRRRDTELVRMIYFALRDKDWRTVPGRIDDEHIEHTGGGFRISYRYSSQGDQIAMNWQVTITGTPDNRILFDIEGVALNGFQINRAGICVHHPIAECRGKPCLIGHPDGSAELRSFPDMVSPHQIFRDIKTMQWEAAPSLYVRLHFSGEVFETEDHRNWTDHSFKTYSTPLDRPYPVFLQQGAAVRQSLTVISAMPPLEEDPGNLPTLSAQKNGDFSSAPQQAIIYSSPTKRSLPAVGICRPGARQTGWLAALARLSTTGFSHYRVELNLSHPDRMEDWQNAREEAILLDLPLELVLYFSVNFREEAGMLTEMAGGVQIKHILILEAGACCTCNELIAYILPFLRSSFPGIPVGSGTDANFAELNRSTLDTSSLDFISFSINPQVHASDDLTLIENMEAQGEVLLSAGKKFPGKQIHVSPVTLRQRYCPDAADPRQSSAFIAGWTLGSLKYLAENGVASISYYEAAGEKGLLAYTKDGRVFPYPVLGIFEELLNKGWKEIQLSHSDLPLMVSSLVLWRGSEKAVLLVNHTAADINVTLSEKNSPFREKNTQRIKSDSAVTLHGQEIRLL